MGYNSALYPNYCAFAPRVLALLENKIAIPLFAKEKQLLNRSGRGLGNKRSGRGLRTSRVGRVGIFQRPRNPDPTPTRPDLCTSGRSGRVGSGLVGLGRVGMGFPDPTRPFRRSRVGSGRVGIWSSGLSAGRDFCQVGSGRLRRSARSGRVGPGRGAFAVPH